MNPIHGGFGRWPTTWMGQDALRRVWISFHKFRRRRLCPGWESVSGLVWPLPNSGPAESCWLHRLNRKRAWILGRALAPVHRDEPGRREPAISYRTNSRPHSAGNEMGLHATFTNDAPHELTKRAFQLELNCFWALRDCRGVNTIAPALREDAEKNKQDTYEQLISGKCPDSIVEGRMRYLPDVSVSLLQITGSRRIEVNEEGEKVEDWFTDYALKEQIRGENFEKNWKNVRFRQTIPSVDDPTGKWQIKSGRKRRKRALVLFFGHPRFYSCRFIPATPSNLDIVRKTPVPPKRPEDRRGLRIM